MSICEINLVLHASKAIHLKHELHPDNMSMFNVDAPIKKTLLLSLLYCLLIIKRTKGNRQKMSFHNLIKRNKGYRKPNGQSRDIVNTGHTRHRMNTNKNKTKHRNTENQQRRATRLHQNRERIQVRTTGKQFLPLTRQPSCHTYS